MKQKSTVKLRLPQISFRHRLAGIAETPSDANSRYVPPADEFYGDPQLTLAEKSFRRSMISRVNLEPKSLAASVYYSDGLTQSKEVLRQRYHPSKDPNNRVHIPYYHRVAKIKRFVAP